MLSVGWFVVAVVVAVLLTTWVTFTLTRLDRLHARVDAAWAALDAQLVRRAAAVLGAAESAGLDATARATCERVAHEALDATGSAGPAGTAGGDPSGSRGGEAALARQETENAVGRALADLVTRPTLRPEAAQELHETANRVLIARRFYNDAVRDTRTLRARRMPRLLRLAGRRAVPQFFDIDDTVPTGGSPAATPAATPTAPPAAVPPARPAEPRPGRHPSPAPEQAEEVP